MTIVEKLFETNNFPNASFASGQSRLTNFSFDIEGNSAAYTFYRFTFENNQEGTGGDAGKLIQLGEITLLSKQ